MLVVFYFGESRRVPAKQRGVCTTSRTMAMYVLHKVCTYVTSKLRRVSYVV